MAHKFSSFTLSNSSFGPVSGVPTRLSALRGSRYASSKVSILACKLYMPRSGVWLNPTIWSVSICLWTKQPKRDLLIAKVTSRTNIRREGMYEWFAIMPNALILCSKGAYVLSPKKDSSRCCRFFAAGSRVANPSQDRPNSPGLSVIPTVCKLSVKQRRLSNLLVKADRSSAKSPGRVRRTRNASKGAEYQLLPRLRCIGWWKECAKARRTFCTAHMSSWFGHP